MILLVSPPRVTRGSSMARWIDENIVLEHPRSRWIDENSVLERPGSRWINGNSVLERPRSRWIDENSVLDLPANRPFWRRRVLKGSAADGRRPLYSYSTYSIQYSESDIEYRISASLGSGVQHTDTIYTPRGTGPRRILILV